MAMPNIDFLFNTASIHSFISDMNLEEKFKKDFGCSIDDWDYRTTDDEVIAKYLEEMDGVFFFIFREENNGSFDIYEIKTPSDKEDKTENLATVINLISGIPSKHIVKDILPHSIAVVTDGLEQATDSNDSSETDISQQLKWWQNVQSIINAGPEATEMFCS